jgi:hypothetical protein
MLQDRRCSQLIRRTINTLIRVLPTHRSTSLLLRRRHRGSYRKDLLLNPHLLTVVSHPSKELFDLQVVYLESQMSNNTEIMVPVTIFLIWFVCTSLVTNKNNTGDVKRILL